MSSHQGRLTTTGRSHNKRSNTYASKSELIVRELILGKKTNKSYINSCDIFFKPLSSNGQAKITNADPTTNCSETACSDSTCSGESESKASQKFISEGSCCDSNPQSVENSSTPEIPKQNSFDSGTRSSAVIDSRITDDKLSFTIKWEERFTWA